MMEYCQGKKTYFFPSLFHCFCSRWKEKLFLLTSDHIHCFKKKSLAGLTQTKDYMFKVKEWIWLYLPQYLLLQVKMDSVSAISMFDKRGFLTLSLIIEEDCKKRILIRKAEGLREWFNIIKVGQMLSWFRWILSHVIISYFNMK